MAILLSLNFLRHPQFSPRSVPKVCQKFSWFCPRILAQLRKSFQISQDLNSTDLGTAASQIGRKDNSIKYLSRLAGHSD